MTFAVEKLVARFAEIVVSSHNTVGANFSQIDSIEHCSSNSLVFVDDASQIPDITPAVMVTRTDIANDFITQFTTVEGKPSCCVISVDNVRLAQAKIKQAYQDYKSSDAEWDAVHATAVIHSSVELSLGVRVGPNVVIGSDVSIGAGTQIRANAVIEHGVKIGKNCVINPLVNIGYDCVLGDRVNIHTGVVVGNEGFGFAQDSERNYHRIPHTGNVIIGNDVQIGANSNIDRGTYQATKIGNGVKLDSLCHIAHNVHIDEGSLFASQACIAGSSYIGKRVMASGQVGVLDHLKVADNTVLVHRSGVTESISKPGMYAGIPAKPFKEYVRGLAMNKRLDRIASQIKDLKLKLKV